VVVGSLQVDGGVRGTGGYEQFQLRQLPDHCARERCAFPHGDDNVKVLQRSHHAGR
jgi:hypothetical protein